LKNQLNYLLAIVSLVTLLYQVRLYLLIKSNAFFVMSAAILYLTLYRALLPVYPWFTKYGIAMPFYILLMLSATMLYHTLTKYILHGTHQWEKKWEYVFTGGLCVLFIAIWVYEIW